MKKPKHRFFIPLLIFTILFYTSTVLPHETVGGIINSWFENVTRAQYDKTILIILSVSVLIYSLILGRSLFIHKERRTKGLLYLVLTIIFCILAMRYLTIINIEAIHFLQYGLISVLVFHLVKRYDYTIWIVFLLGFMDECYQHFYLTPNRFRHLDFNDMWLDLIGAGFGLASLYCLNRKSGPSNKPLRNTIIGIYATLIIASIIFYFTGLLQIWPADDGIMAPIQIMEQHIEGFWTTVRKVHQYHIMRPLEGCIILLATILFYTRLEDN